VGNGLRESKDVKHVMNSNTLHFRKLTLLQAGLVKSVAFIYTFLIIHALANFAHPVRYFDRRPLQIRRLAKPFGY
jgi:hypothetical protein